jgi:hypothetical protein
MTACIHHCDRLPNASIPEASRRARLASTGFDNDNLCRQPLLESFGCLVALSARGGFGDRNQHFGEDDGIADERHAIEAQEGISRREAGPLVAFLECLRLGDAYGQQNGLADDARALVMGCPSRTVNGRFEFVRMQERTGRRTSPFNDYIVQRDHILKRQVFKQGSSTGQMTVASLILFPALLENLLQPRAQSGIVRGSSILYLWFFIGRMDNCGRMDGRKDFGVCGMSESRHWLDPPVLTRQEPTRTVRTRQEHLVYHTTGLKNNRHLRLLYRNRLWSLWYVRDRPCRERGLESAVVNDAWPRLPGAVRASILMLVKAASRTAVPT